MCSILKRGPLLQRQIFSSLQDIQPKYQKSLEKVQPLQNAHFITSTHPLLIPWGKKSFFFVFLGRGQQITDEQRQKKRCNEAQTQAS